MAGFKGQAEYKVDEKGRVALPAKMRRAVRPEANDTFVATRGFEQCVFLYPLDVWEKKEAEMSGLNLYQSEARDFVRTLLMWAEEGALDGQSRFSLPKSLLDFAGLTPKGQAIIIGALDHIEIWNPEILDAHLNQQAAAYETLAERVMGGMR
ncbi:MAG TPA: division/cell wall cluster transcriptional repressor MraZ [Rubricoccaceae bacterium]|nr:division/cell wall cluster transcriptional repressor MraZ [Rubricoccaceae bacterium]